MVLRDLALARLTGARVHFQHLSTARQRRPGAGRPGRPGCRSPPRPRPTTSRSPTPRCAGYDPVFKVNPPLRTDGRRGRRCKAGLADGALDAIATDHAPHAPHLKELPFDQAPPGMLGLETALALALTELDLPDRARCWPCCRGSRRAIAGLDAATAARSSAGRPANLCVIDPARDVGGRPGRAGQPGPQHALRRPARSPGRVRHTLLGGEPVVVDGEASDDPTAARMRRDAPSAALGADATTRASR